MNEMKIGVTGAFGFIGSHFLKSKEATFSFEGELTNYNEVVPFVEKSDMIYHIAGKNREKDGNILKNNIISTANIVYASMLKRPSPGVVFISSTQLEQERLTEYGLAKSTEEDLMKKLEKWCIFRVPNVYGPGSKPNYNSVVANFCDKIVNGKDPIVNDPDSVREFIYIDDLIECISHPYFCSHGRPQGEGMSIGEVAAFLTSKLGEHENLTKTLKYYEMIKKGPLEGTVTAALELLKLQFKFMKEVKDV